MRSILLSIFVVLALCSCDGASGEAFISGTLAASYDGAEFEPVNGFATVSNGQVYIALGEGALHCGSETASSPPHGYNLVARPSALAVGTYTSVLVQMFSTANGFEGIGSNEGTVTITAVTDESVSGSIEYDYVDHPNDVDRVFTVSGTFEVVHCAY